MTMSIKGKIRNGVALPLKPVSESDEGRDVIITFLDDEARTGIAASTNGAKSLEELVAECTIDTGISDLASQHDHYLYGKPKK
jgi:hypothetical protein